MGLYGNTASRGLKSTVYFIEEINPANIIEIYNALGRDLGGTNVAVKISTGEPGGHNFLDPKLIAPFVDMVNGTIVECNTAYHGKRYSSEDHWEAIRAHGFLDIARVDLLDEYGDFAIPVRNGFHLDKNFVGEGIKKYNTMVMLSHFKGHRMAGFGGALKNMSIGLASSRGKTYIHTGGVYERNDNEEIFLDKFHVPFLESMADADKAVMDYMGKNNIIYINIANKLSVDCDCSDHPEPPKMADIGIFASLDPVALDRACVDAVYRSKDPGRIHLIERMESREGVRIIEAATKHGLGSPLYDIVKLS